MPPDRALFARDYFPRFKSCPPPLPLVLSHVPSLCLGLVAVFRSVSVLSHEFRQVFGSSRASEWCPFAKPCGAPRRVPPLNLSPASPSTPPMEHTTRHEDATAGAPRTVHNMSAIDGRCDMLETTFELAFGRVLGFVGREVAMRCDEFGVRAVTKEGCRGGDWESWSFRHGGG